jgi:hypothetical protein
VLSPGVFRLSPSTCAELSTGSSELVPGPRGRLSTVCPQVHKQDGFQNVPESSTVRIVSLTSADDNAEVRIAMRAPCSRCGCTEGCITTKSGQDTVWCVGCQSYCYNAPRSETGRATRSLRTRPDVRPSQRARILVRDGGACILCHRSGVELEIGHLISVHDGRALGMSEAELNGDDNLAAMCKSCNSGLSSSSLPPRLLAAAMWARSRTAKPGDVESNSCA